MSIMFVVYLALIITIIVLFVIIIYQSEKLNIDNLTGISNDHFFARNNKKYLRKNKFCFLLMVDLKKFKKINDLYGHSMGDKYLISFANLAKSNFEESLVARRSGDEFVILTKFNEEEIKKRLEKIQEGIDDKFNKKEIPLRFEFNVGISRAPSKVLNGTYEEADKAMYIAKEKNKLYELYIKKD